MTLLKNKKNEKQKTKPTAVALKPYKTLKLTKMGSLKGLTKNLKLGSNTDGLGGRS